MIDKYRVSVLYAAPAMIRASMARGGNVPARYDLNSLRLLGSGTEPLSTTEWMWYRHDVGRDRCPIVDTWQQPETGAIMASPLPGVTATKPGCVMKPLPGISMKVVDQRGHRVGHGQSGVLVVDRPWPAMPRGIGGDQHFFPLGYRTDSEQQGGYFTGQAAAYDSDGDLWLIGRTNDAPPARAPRGPNEPSGLLGR
jgi:acetyl-CoA synthetase